MYGQVLEGFRDESGLFAVIGHYQAAHLTYLGLHALQHRGREGARIVASDGSMLRSVTGEGLVQEVFAGTRLGELRGTLAVGQTFGTGFGEMGISTASPCLFARYAGGQLCIAMSGRFSNGQSLRDELKGHGCLFYSPSDAEILGHLLARSTQRTLVNRLVDALWKVEGAYSMVIATEDVLIAVRDARGVRPLLLGWHEQGTIVSSESAAIRFIGGEVSREVRPGEMVIVDATGLRSVSPFVKKEPARCIHEMVALSRADSVTFGGALYPLRVKLGQTLAKAAPCPRADVVVGIPPAGTPAALGFAEASKLPFREGLIRAPYTGRQYLEPARGVANFGARILWNTVPSVVDGQRIALVTATLVTGRGVRKAISLLREAGAIEVHLRVAAPPIEHACRYGVGSPCADELIARMKTQDFEMARALSADSVGFLSIEGLYQGLSLKPDSFCDACFTGEYPIAPEVTHEQLPLFDDAEGSSR
jgi:amidophosphoribosyltransferase